MKIIFDRAQMLWAVQRELREANYDNALTRTAITMIMKNSPAAALTEIGVIYFHGDIPDYLFPLILNHEELHILTHRILKEDFDRIKADLGTKFIDNPKFTWQLCEVFGISFKDLINYLHDYILDRMLLIGSLRRLIRKAKEGLRRNSRNI